MDFGDILDTWDEQCKKTEKEKKKQHPAGSGKKLNAPSLYQEENTAANNSKTQEDSSKKTINSANQRVNPMETWLERYGVIDKDRMQEEEERRADMQDASTLQYMPAEATLDLHGLTREEAWERFDSFITECQRRKLQKVLIIHGKGNHSSDSPVLNGMVKNFIERDHRLGASGHPDKSQGGRGATWVLIRQKTSL